MYVAKLLAAAAVAVGSIWVGVAGQQTDKTAQAAAPAATEQPKPAEVERISVEELRSKLAKKEPVLILDVRSEGSYSEIVKGAVRMPLNDIESRLKEIPRDKEIVTYCS